MITTCTMCGVLYEAGSEEQANEPGRLCFSCRAAVVSRLADDLFPGDDWPGWPPPGFDADLDTDR